MPKRLTYEGPDQDVILKLRKPHYTGQTEFRFAPTELFGKLAALIPPQYQNLTLFHGIFAANHKARSALAQLVPEPLPKATQDADADSDISPNEKFQSKKLQTKRGQTKRFRPPIAAGGPNS